MKLELTEQQLTVIGNALGAMPFNQSAPVLAELQKQVNAQIQKPTEEVKE